MLRLTQFPFSSPDTATMPVFGLHRIIFAWLGLIPTTIRITIVGPSISLSLALIPFRPVFPPTHPLSLAHSVSSHLCGSPPPYTPFPLAHESRSSSHLSQNLSTAFLAQYSPQRMRPHGASSDSESDPDPLDEDETARSTPQKHFGNGVAFRSRIFPQHSKGITTARDPVRQKVRRVNW
ncbi:hypothetical protein EDB85DRAFT_2182016 [Lactarius pseudohatsudake]|nr:hypothetical protein EDB85DRAFT_2182016 [Lactarius pseudohatsudake]